MKKVPILIKALNGWVNVPDLALSMEGPQAYLKSVSRTSYFCRLIPLSNQPKNRYHVFIFTTLLCYLSKKGSK